MVHDVSSALPQGPMKRGFVYLESNWSIFVSNVDTAVTGEGSNELFLVESEREERELANPFKEKPMLFYKPLIRVSSGNKRFTQGFRYHHCMRLG